MFSIVRRRWLAFSLLALVAFPTVSFAGKKKPAEGQAKNKKFAPADVEFFEKRVRPILVRRCYSCHSGKAKKLKGKLRLDSRDGVLRGGETGAAVQPRNPAKSLLIDAINYGDVYQMPPKSKLPPAEIAVLTRWVKLGIPWGHETATAATGVAKAFDLRARQRSHWAWQPIRRRPAPAVKNGGWARMDLDKFVQARLESKGLSPAADASKEVWLRRVHFDLIGLPPSPQEVTAFLQDGSDKAHQKVVDRLLKSKHFGERWARHWMDLVRYAETFGHEFDYPIRNAYRYRDYLIRAFNADVPFNEFIVEHVAGDLLRQPRLHKETGTNESILGTGFWMLGEMTHSPVDVRDDEARRIDNQLDVMGKTFLGLTIGCARCHDHKFDAISTRDYYALVGFLQSSDRSTGLLDPAGKIRAATSQLDDARQQAGQALKKLNSVDQLASYLLASRDVLLQAPNAGSQTRQRVEGESFKVLKSSSGKVQKQGLNFASGRSQLWWTDSKIGGQLDLQLNVAVTGEYALTVGLVQSYDYGIAQFLIDGKPLNRPVDLYHPRARALKPKFLGKLQLTAGKHTLTIKMVGKNKRSQPRHMVGFDYLDLVGQATTAGGKAVAEAAKRHGLKVASLWRFVRALADVQVRQTDHPLYLWGRLARLKDDQFASEISSQRRRIEKELKDDRQSVLFSRSFKSWRRTGPAFDTPPTRLGDWDSTSRLVRLARPGMAHSGDRSAKLQGVLRSPTFTLSHRFIDYRLMARNAQIRVIIDGYTMDVYNGLLFRGAAMRADTGGKLRWLRQSGDVSRYIGHRAHIEVIDHGDGFAAIDEIRFTNGHRPQPKSVLVSRLVLDRKLRSPQMVAREYERLLTNTGKGWIQGKAERDLATFINWQLRHGLMKPSSDVADKVTAARKRCEQIESQMPRPIHVMAIADGTPEDEYLFIRGNHKTPASKVARRFLEALGGKRIPIRPADGSGRLKLARQMADSRNPLTSRVIVNRIWHHLTGRGIVASVDNFGVLGDRPTHPLLLDHLAYTFVRDDDWSLKQLIRRIVLSSTYRMSSKPNAAGTKADPQNLLLHRMRIRRLQGETIRDAILTASGRLDRKMYGPSVPIHVTSHMQGRGRPRRNGPLDGHGRRSLYIEIRRNFLSPMMLAFDSPIPFNSMGRRNQSNVPAQALILMNDPFVVSQAKQWGKRLAAANQPADQRIQQMYQQAFGRSAGAREVSLAKQFFLQQADEKRVPRKQMYESAEIWGDLCHVMFNVKEFIFLR